MGSARFGRVLTAMVTPFDGDGRLDLDAVATLARWLVDRGNDGLVVAGTTGESPTLTDDEKLDLWRAVREAVNVPIVAGVGTYDTAHTIELAQQAAGIGVDGFLVVGPYYNRPPQAGIEAHFRAVAAATDVPIMIYDVPARTGKRIATDVLLRLYREVPSIVAFKDATGDPAGAATLIAELGEGIDLYSGDDSMTLPMLAVGAVGVVGVATHWCSPQMSEMIAAFEKGDLVGARQLNARMFESYAFSATDDWNQSMSSKAMLRTQGLSVGECRLPLPPTPPGMEDRAREVWAKLHG